ncbi:MAG: sugar transferase [Ignavibacteria bacterium]|nr:sugar transferase [Ignavibacteria bacterium]
MNKNKPYIIFVFDFIAINFAWLIFFYFRVQTGLFDFVIMPAFLIPMFVVYCFWLIIFTFVGMYKTWFASSRFDEISTLFKSSFIGVLVLFFLIFIDDVSHGVDSPNRFLIFIYWGVLFLLVSIGRVTVRSIQRNLLIKGIGRRNTIIVGFNNKSKEIGDEIKLHPALGLDVVGFLAVKNENLGKEHNGQKVIDNIEKISKVIDELNIKEVIIVLETHQEDTLIDIISKCESKNVGLKIAPDLYEILSGQARTAQLYGFPLIDINPQLMPEWEKKIKRILDIVISFIALIISSPIILLMALAIRIDTPGSAFFRQERCGKNGKVFKLFKFRSMYDDAEKLSGPVWSQKNDPRVTRVGKFIRKIRLDELPQMINVLKGEMSLVGPRPERPFFVEKLAEEIPYYKRRLKVKPGITGWAQVKHKYDESVEDVKTKLRFDLFYIENMSLRMDFKILFRTIFVVFLGKGHYD